MNVIVVYESHWGNTAAVARAIAEGYGPDARVMTTDAATTPVVAEADLIIAGAPVMGFNLPTDKMLESLTSETARDPAEPDLTHASMRAWLEGLPAGHGRAVGFDTRVRWSPAGATGSIDRILEGAGYRMLAKPAHFVVTGKYGPLRDGELERARRWGAELSSAMSA
jgi:hypothetical protein